jgi:electron transport complex protein RnfC
MTECHINVSGPAAARPGRYRIPVGTPFAEVVRHVGLDRPLERLVDGGAMTGRAVACLDAVVTKQTTGILLHDDQATRTPRPGPCIRCGWCQEDCPVGLDPVALLNTLERPGTGGAARLHPEACIECGVCSYVCPADLPLAAAAVTLKRRAQGSMFRVQRSALPSAAAGPVVEEPP